MGYRPISEYAIVGNDDRCALVDLEGSIDWCCFPHVAGPSVFARLLDDERGGHFAVRPTATHDVEQRYRDLTNVLETTFETGSGRATLTDFMPVSRRDRPPEFQRAVYRRLQCEEGALSFELEFKPRFDYARANTSVGRDGRGVVAAAGDERLHLRVCGEFDVRIADDRAVGTHTLTAGETVWFVLGYGSDPPTSTAACRRALEETTAYWREWAEGLADCAAPITDGEPWLDAVLRSGLVLKLLINEGTGATYAAPTTSLPEEYGESRNWDYRYNWIRDAKFTVQALYSLGQREEAQDYFEWFSEISHDDPEAIQPVYGVHGERDLTEFRLDHLAGYRHSTPVRVGNSAAKQRQLDVYGSIVQGYYETLRHRDEIPETDWASIRGLVDHVCGVWDQRDAGIWEFRNGPRHFVYSKLLCWVALDRGLKLAVEHDLTASLDRWRRERSRLRDAIETRGYSESVGSFVQTFETDEALDAACLLVPVYGFLPADDPRVEATIETALDRLLTDEGLVYRTRDSDVLPDEHGAFVFCTFWLVDALALAGRTEEAREIFANVREYATPLGLLSERIDVQTGELLGNFPQAFSHIGLINSAIYLAGAERGKEGEHDAETFDEQRIQPLFRT